MALDIKLIEFNLRPEFSFRRISKRRPDIIGLLKRFICYNQGRYIEFEYLVGERHKEMKEALKNSDGSSEELNRSYNELGAYVEKRLYDISTKNFNEYIVQYFQLAKGSKIPPRVCIKAARGHNMLDLYRLDRAYGVPEHPISENTGFEYVHKVGKYYVCNDIPTTAKKGLYVNPRLDDQRVRSYRLPSWLGKRWPFKSEIDGRWCNCWKFDKRFPDWMRSCYKSTLIIPMTLLNCEIDEEFKKRFFTTPQYDNRTIWGFLCLDHPAVDYFCQEDDWRVGYIFADFLSLYFISAFIHTSISKTFGRAEKTLGKQKEEKND